MPIRLLTSGGGTTTIQPTTSASSVTLTVPSVNANVVTTGDTASVTQAMLGSGLAGTGPAFYAYNGGANQSVTASQITKVALTSTLFDTSSRFDTTNYRFLPLIAGYYQINCNLVMSNVTIAGSPYCGVNLYKNGSNYGYQSTQPNNSNWSGAFLGTLVYLNGSTDYVEMYCQYSGGGTWQVNSGGATNTHMCGYLVRAA